MNYRSFFVLAPLAALGLGVGCIRSYVTAPLSTASLDRSVRAESGLSMQTRAFLTKPEIAERFGRKLAEDREVIPVQVLLDNQGTQVYRVLRTAFVLVETGKDQRLPSLTADEICHLGRHGFLGPILTMVAPGLGVAGLVTTIQANGQERADYGQKLLQEALLDPGKDLQGVVFFNPKPAGLNRLGHFKLVLEVENLGTHAKETLEQPLG